MLNDSAGYSNLRTAEDGEQLRDRMTRRKLTLTLRCLQVSHLPVSVMMLSLGCHYAIHYIKFHDVQRDEVFVATLRQILEAEVMRRRKVQITKIGNTRFKMKLVLFSTTVTS